MPNKEKYVTIPVVLESPDTAIFNLKLLVVTPILLGPSRKDEVVDNPEILKISWLRNPWLPV